MKDEHWSSQGHTANLVGQLGKSGLPLCKALVLSIQVWRKVLCKERDPEDSLRVQPLPCS